MIQLSQLQERFRALDPDARRLILILIALLLLIITLYSALSGYLSALDTRKTAREGTLKELLILRQRYHEAAADAQRLNNRMASVTPSDSPVSVIEQSVVIPKAGIQSKPLPRQERGTVTEEGAEITLSGLSLNDTVNLLHSLEQGAKPIAVRKAVLRTRFSDPAKLDLTLQVALFRPSGQTRP